MYHNFLVYFNKPNEPTSWKLLAKNKLPGFLFIKIAQVLLSFLAGSGRSETGFFYGDFQKLLIKLKLMNNVIILFVYITNNLYPGMQKIQLSWKIIWIKQSKTPTTRPQFAL